MSRMKRFAEQVSVEMGYAGDLDPFTIFEVVEIIREAAKQAGLKVRIRTTGGCGYYQVTLNPPQELRCVEVVLEFKSDTVGVTLSSGIVREVLCFSDPSFFGQFAKMLTDAWEAATKC